MVWEDGKAGKFGFVPISYIKITACKHQAFLKYSGEIRMTYVVADACVKCKYTDCVDVCPVDCFHEGPNFLVIDPEECIDCTLCVAECPVEAIFAEDDVPDDQRDYIALNAELAKVWKVIIEKKDALPDADEWADVKNKRQYLER